ncbi:MAG: hypothetical protein SWY16_24700 [Cyanobacteriota bacterium]|nr:hypothetical protein [Cyanobacteriota bacterium]
MTQLTLINVKKLKKRLRQMFLGILVGVCAIVAIAFPRFPAIAQITQATVQEILDGDEVFIEEEKASLNQVADFNQIVRTQDSRTALLFSNLAAGRLAPESSVTVGQCVEVREGQLVASGPVNGCLAGFTADVRGTIYVLNAEDEGRFQVLEGEVEIDRADGESVAIPQGQQVAIEDGELGEVEAISVEEYIEILEGALFRGFEVPLPGQEQLIGICNELRRDALGGDAGATVGSVLGVPECPRELGLDIGPAIDPGLGLPF